MLEGVITNFHSLTHAKINYIAKNMKIVWGDTRVSIRTYNNSLGQKIE